MNVIFIIIVGAAAGFVATRLMKVETDILTTVAIGVIGALIGGLVLRIIVSVGSVAFGFLGAVVGAAFLIWFWQTYVRK
ncbi:GlsB/YeaQ/YmgE family stress response membrane protein [Maritimibacter sp. UBA3975]|uniref:GlsB/YeaQ/YmgE family stress response membrane protein n=1 Tax=Maritimibacter sp. UBA3975 TaxID=1946833 RepID=UPI000C0B094F|nr:GlsB/YeaQ/YmgE family stress response membrane protein [Maritimibacter sp. UBA3975]MAM61905.1 GlsB/YeaQ/YmgE family stress response membrane protein [Maritimibacter sp.]|tara:strand:+ start:3424 stop:3660 length:237 start_codon:yes stop_codon:yes gene_type:complete